MTSAKFSNKLFSKALITENLRRFWGISGVGFLIVFLGGPFTILRNYDDLSAYTVNDVCSNFCAGSVAGLFCVIVLPIVSALACFSYLHRSTSVSAVHARPCSRKMLFAGNGISALILSAVPFILNALILLVIRKDVFNPVTGVISDYYGTAQSFAVDAAGNMFTYRLILSGLAKAIISVLFVLSLSILGNMISGTIVISGLTAAALNFVAPVVYSFAMGYGEEFRYGFVYANTYSNTATAMNPILRYYDGTLTWLNALIYIAVSAIILALGQLSYKYRRLERAGQSYVYGFIGCIITVILSFLAASLGTELLGVNFILGLAIGLVLGFIISYMIVSGSFKIFNIKGLKMFGITVAAVGIFVAGLALDITGYETRIPDKTRIDSVSISTGLFRTGCDGNFDIEDDENIALACDIHKNIVDSQKLGGDEDSDSCYIYINYTMKGGRIVEREYRVSREVLMNSASMEKLYYSDETKERFGCLDELDCSLCLLNINGEPTGNYSWFNEGVTLSRGTEDALKEELLAALSRDLNNLSFEDACASRIPWAGICFDEYNRIDSDLSERSDSENRMFSYAFEYDNESNVTAQHTYLEISVSDLYVNTVKVLDKYKFTDKIFASEGDCFAVQSTAENYLVSSYEGIPESEEGMYVVSDIDIIKEMIRYGVISSSDDNSANPDTVYMKIYYFTDSDDNRYAESYWNNYVLIDSLPVSVQNGIDRYIK